MKTRYLLPILAILVILSAGTWHFSSTNYTERVFAQNVDSSTVQKATFAGGCFWCMEPPFENRNGVKQVVSGFMGGTVKNPSYDEVAAGNTNHLEVVQIVYNPEVITYKDLLEVYWRQINPTDNGGQFVDRGHQYLSRIFYHTQDQKKLAEQSKQRLESSDIFQKPIVTDVVEAKTFYRAPDYHQNYYKTHKWQYKYYRWNSGRDDYLEKTWSGHEEYEIFPAEDQTMSTDKKIDSEMTWDPDSFTKPSKSKLKEQLSSMQFKVTQKDGTEPAHNNKYWDNKKPGIYVDVVSGEPLFSSTHKFKSGTGWPSFYKPLEEKNIVTEPDNSLLSTRTEVRSKHADSHLGHVFEDGPDPTGKRYCINSAALEFIPADELEERGYSEYKSLFKN